MEPVILRPFALPTRMLAARQPHALRRRLISFDATFARCVAEFWTTSIDAHTPQSSGRTPKLLAKPLEAYFCASG